MADKNASDTNEKLPDGNLATPPEPEKDNEETVKRWLDKVSRTSAWRNQLGEKAGWPRFIKEFKGDWDLLQQNVDIPLIPINMVFAYTKTEIARLYFRDPWITVNAKRVEDLGSAQIAEQLLNYTWGEIDLKRQIKLAMLDALLVGHGWVKLGYTAEFGTVESKPKRGPGRPKKEDKDVDVNEFVKSENVFAYHIPYNQVIFDPSATWPATHNARWMAFKTVKPLSVVRASKNYKNASQIRASELPPNEQNVYGQEGEWVSIWEIWDKEHKKIFTVAEGSKDYLREPQDWPYDFDGFPAVMLSFNPIPGEPYPLSDIAPWEGQVVELTKMMAIMMNHLKRWNRQIFVPPDFMTEEEKTKFKTSQDGAIIEYQGQDPAKLFIPPYAPVQQDIYGVWNLVMDIFRNVSGQSETERGASAKTGTRTLGELRMTMQGSKSRSDEKVDVIEEFIAEIARKILSIMQQKFDIPKIVRIVGPKAFEKAVAENRPSAQGPEAENSYTQMGSAGDVSAMSVTRKDIHGDMDVDCVAGSTIPLNKENQLEIMEKLLPLLENIGLAPGSKSAIEFGREYLRLVNIMSLERIMDLATDEAEQNAQNPKPDPELQAKQAEIQMKMQADQQKSQVQLQGQQAKQEMDMKALAAKTQAAIVKAKIDIQKAQLQAHAHERQTQITAQANEHKANLDAKTQQHKSQMDIQKQILSTMLAARKVNESAKNGNHES